MNRNLITQLSLLWKALIVLFVIVGVAVQITNHGWHMMRYYTTESNIIVGVFLAYLIWRYLTKGSWTVNSVRLKGGITMVILLTGMVYHFMLRPIAKPEDFWTINNILLHYVVPITTVIDWLVFDRPRTYRWWDPLWWTFFPIVYAISAVTIGVVTRIPIGDNPDGPFPYFFLNVDKFGYGGVLLYCLALAVGFMLFSYLLVLVKNVLSKRPQF